MDVQFCVSIDWLFACCQGFCFLLNNTTTRSTLVWFWSFAVCCVFLSLIQTGKTVISWILRNVYFHLLDHEFPGNYYFQFLKLIYCNFPMKKFKIYMSRDKQVLKTGLPNRPNGLSQPKMDSNISQFPMKRFRNPHKSKKKITVDSQVNEIWFWGPSYQYFNTVMYFCTNIWRTEYFGTLSVHDY